VDIQFDSVSENCRDRPPLPMQRQIGKLGTSDLKLSIIDDR